MDFQRAARIAERLITENGVSLLINGTNTGYAVLMPVSKSFQQNPALDYSQDASFYALTSSSTTITEGDELLISGVTYAATRVEPLNPNGNAIIYQRVYLRTLR